MNSSDALRLLADRCLAAVDTTFDGMADMLADAHNEIRAAITASPGAEQAPAVDGGDAECCCTRGVPGCTGGAWEGDCSACLAAAPAPAPAVMLNGMTEAETDTTASVMGLRRPAPAVGRYTPASADSFDSHHNTTPLAEARDPGAEQGDAVPWEVRHAAERTRADLGETGKNYPDIRTLLAYVEQRIPARAPHTNSGDTP